MGTTAPIAHADALFGWQIAAAASTRPFSGAQQTDDGTAHALPLHLT
jgi:hypothetical protein